MEPLEPELLSLLSAWFDERFLGLVRVAHADKIVLRPRCLQRFVGHSILSPEGIALGDQIVMATPRDRSDYMAVLFHELVHVQQYQTYGTPGFCSKYLRGWCKSGWSYTMIPLEEQAFALQDRFTAGERFHVEHEVSKTN